MRAGHAAMHESFSLVTGTNSALADLRFCCRTITSFANAKTVESMSHPPRPSLVQNRQRDTAPSLHDDAFARGMTEEPGWSEYRDILLDHKWLIGCVIGLALLFSVVYVVLATPIYRANLLIQIEDSAPESKSFLTDTTGLGELKTTANGEIQIIGSRMVLGAAVDQVNLDVSAHPRYLPLVGAWLARGAKELSNPGFLGYGGYVTGTERIAVKRFEVPVSLEDMKPFMVTVQAPGRYVVTHELLDKPLEGTVGKLSQYDLPGGTMTVQIDELSGNPGAQFMVSVASRLRAVEGLQNRLILSEQGRQSNVVNVALEDSDPARLGLTLNAIADQYVRQNVERKSAEAEKTLAFLNSQLPVFERQLKTSEDAFARFRNQNGTIAFDEEGKVWLKSSADLQTNILELQQNRLELRRTNNDNHPKIQTLNQQIAAAQSELASVNKRIAAMPNMQRDALRLERDVRSNSAQYQSMQNNALQMRLLREGKIGNVRMLDKAVVSRVPVKPQKTLIVAFALVLGALLGIGAAILRTRAKQGIQDANDVAAKTGLELFGVVPESPEQAAIARTEIDRPDRKILADIYPHSHSVEAMRGLRMALKTNLDGACNNRILFTGATPEIGKTFLATNFALLLAQTGKHVLFVNADLRKEDRFGAIDSPHAGGLSELAQGQVTVAQAIRTNVRPHFDVLPAGKLPLLPTDLLESQAFLNLLETLSHSYDHVVIDSAPILLGADATAIAQHCGCVLLVARAGSSEMKQLHESIRRLEQAGAVVDGLIVNGMQINRSNSSAYGYGYATRQPVNRKGALAAT